MPQYNAIEARGIVKQFGALRALDDVEFDLRPGEIHALLGENGAGKSTLMNIMRGHLHPTAGQILVNGRPVTIGSPADATRLGIGMVHQHFLLVPVLTVLENLTLADPKSRFLLRPRDVERRARQLCERLGWQIPFNARIADLPVGVQQRVEILRVLLADASILLFDEPTAVLAPTEIDDLLDVLRVLAGQGRSIIFVSHKLSEVTSVCDRVTVLRRGKVTGLVAIGETDERDLARRMVGDDASLSETESLLSAAPNEQAPVLSISGLGSPARHKDETTLREITLDAAPGEIVGIAGVDGNGQTELFEVLAGIRRYHAKEFQVPPDVALIPPDRRTQGLALDLSVAENLTLDAAHLPEYRMGPFLRRRALLTLAERLAIEYDIRAADLQQPTRALSGGNQQKIVIARALWRSPRLLVAVSPTRGLDVAATAFVHERLRLARDGGAAILLISTELDEILALANRIHVLYEGRLVGTVGADAPREAIGLLMGGKAGS